MKSITKIIIGLVGVASIGLITYYVVTNDRNVGVNEKPITNPDQDTLATATVIPDTIFDRIKKELSIDGEEFALSEVEEVYINSTKDKILMVNEDVWKRIIGNIQSEFPNIVDNCNQKYEMPNLSDYKFVGLLTYLADSKNTKKTSAYQAIEIRNGNAKSFAGGGICCNCEGEPLVARQVDAVIDK
jgi:hypothetical protein